MLQDKNTIDNLPTLGYYINVPFYLTKSIFAFTARLYLWPKLAKHLPFCIFAGIVTVIVQPNPKVFYFQ